VNPRDEYRYAESGDLSIAYVIDGEGPPDVVLAHGFAGNVDEHGRHGFFARFDGPIRAVRCAQAIGEACKSSDSTYVRVSLRPSVPGSRSHRAERRIR